MLLVSLKLYKDKLKYFIFKKKDILSKYSLKSSDKFTTPGIKIRENCKCINED